MDERAAKVIQFPGKHKDTADVAPAEAASPAPERAATASRPARRGRAGVTLGLFAVALASIAVNRFVYRGLTHVTGSRAIASVGPELERDAAWEKTLAERLAKPGSTVSVASTGRAPSLSERMRFADLGQSYVVTYTDAQLIESVTAHGEPARIDGQSFLTKYGKLFDTGFAAADRIEGDADVEIFALRDAGGRTLAKARFELDHERRLRAIRLLRM